MTRDETVFSILEARASSDGDSIALAPFGAEPITSRSLSRRVLALAAGLQDAGVGSTASGDRVAIVLPNGPDLSIALLAACVAGVAAPFNPDYRADEFEAYFRHANCRFLLCGPTESGEAVEAARSAGLPILRLGIDVPGVASDPAGVRVPKRTPRPGDLAVVLLTSGSTGRGKVVPLTHHNVCFSARAVCESVALGPGDRCLSMWQQFHVGGIVDLLLVPLASGGRVVSAGSFDAARFFAALDEARPTWFQGVPTSLGELCAHAREHGLAPRGSSLRFIRSVASALHPALWREIESLFGVPVVQTFGMTEASPLITSMRLPPARRKLGSTGSSCRCDVAILSEEGRPLPAGEPGMVCVRGENVFAGYENDPDANSEAFLDGWFRTGDLGYLDADGDLFLVGRKKELINRGGEKISPQEVDDVLAGHPAVAQAAAFMRLHPTLGEDVAAAVVLEPGASATEPELRDFVRERLADFKVPRRIFFLDRLPRCPVGKVRRKELSDRFPATRKGIVHVAPRNDLEAKLVRLWERILDVPNVGIDDDFVEIGGDSLSAIRIIVASSDLFGVEIPAEKMSGVLSVRAMAETLERLGARSTSPDPGRAASQDAERPTVESSIRRADVVLSEEEESDEGPGTYSSFQEFEVLVHRRTLLATPAEASSFLHRGRPARRGVARLFQTARMLLDECRANDVRTAIAVGGRRFRMQGELARDVGRGVGAMTWRRERVTPYADLYAAAGDAGRPRNLVVGFTGHQHRLLTATYAFLSALDPTRTEMLLLRSPTRNYYFDGIPGLGDTMEAFLPALDAFARRGNYASVTALGTSGGATVAVVAALANGWGRAVAVGPDILSAQPHVAESLERWHATRSASGDYPAVIVAYAGLNGRDVLGAKDLARVVSPVSVRPDLRFDNHSLFNELRIRGELRERLREFLDQG